MKSQEAPLRRFRATSRDDAKAIARSVTERLTAGQLFELCTVMWFESDGMLERELEGAFQDEFKRLAPQTYAAWERQMQEFHSARDPNPSAVDA